MKRAETKSDSPESPLGVGDAFVAICDWKGTVRWLSNHTIKTQIGDLGWCNMQPEDADCFQEAFAFVATMNQRRVVEISSRDGLRYRIWLMPIGVPELAVCTFNLRIPPEIGTLSDREKELMNFLASGRSLKEAAATLDCSINTVHSHVKNIKTKLCLASPNEVISFASRFFNNMQDPLKIEPQFSEAKVLEKSTKRPAAKRKK